MNASTIAVAMTWILAAFLLFGSGLNAVGPRPIRADYVRWGYPRGFRFVTAGLELAAAILLVVPAFQLAGALLGASIMTAAVATTLKHGEPARAVAPALTLAWAVTAAALIWVAC